MATATQLVEALKKHFGFDTFKGNQEAIMLSLLSGRDPSEPIALMKNQVDAMRNFSENDSVAHFLNSSLSKSAIDLVKADIIAGKTKMLYVAPESLTKDENIEFLKTVPCWSRGFQIVVQPRESIL